MALATIGLKTQLWNNNLKSLALLAGYPFLMLGIIWACAYLLGMAESGQADARAAQFAQGIIMEFWPMILTAIALWFVISWFFNTNMVRALSHSHPVTRKEEPALYNLLENLCIAQGMIMPRLEIIETHARNAFASGIDKNSYTITVTRGLMNALAKDELEGVLAHELSHIKHGDVRLLIVTIIFTGMIGFAAQMVWSSLRYGFIYGGRSRDKQNGGAALLMLGILIVLWVGYFATLLMRFALSRRREYMADAGAIEITKNPKG
ncbi:MAG: M48 family metallopeptidase [Alphaproteobacteria bacterium]|nr:M48 family metallopeptidase [Alphaproteobacteria bacterium]